MATNQGRFRRLHPLAVTSVFALANLLVFLAILCGAVSRWPRVFHNSFEWEPEQLTNPYCKMLESACDGLTGIIASNQITLGEKSSWAKRTYLFVGLALVTYLVLTALLFWLSVPWH